MMQYAVAPGRSVRAERNRGHVFSSVVFRFSFCYFALYCFPFPFVFIDDGSEPFAALVAIRCTTTAGMRPPRWKLPQIQFSADSRQFCCESNRMGNSTGLDGAMEKEFSRSSALAIASYRTERTIVEVLTPPFTSALSSSCQAPAITKP